MHFSHHVIEKMSNIGHESSYVFKIAIKTGIGYVKKITNHQKKGDFEIWSDRFHSFSTKSVPD